MNEGQRATSTFPSIPYYSILRNTVYYFAINILVSIMRWSLHNYEIASVFFCLVSYTGAVDLHLELVEVKPVSGFLGVQVMVAVSGCKAKTMETEVRGQQ